MYTKRNLVFNAIQNIFVGLAITLAANLSMRLAGLIVKEKPAPEDAKAENGRSTAGSE